jgi:CelD/BcsL family acetyltransferase involved in cellulose biosynthesis
MRVELTDDPTAFLGRGWEHLVEADPSGTFFHTPDYLKLWWEEFGTGSLLLAFAEDGDRTLGACAFEVIDGTLLFLGGFDVTDYMGPVALPEHRETVGKELMAALVADAEWERADLRSLPMDSPWLDALEQGAAAQGMRVARGEDGVAPRIPLPSTYDSYLAALPAKLRHEIRRKARRLVEETGPYRVSLATPDTIREDMDLFLQLHRSSPGPKGKFMQAGMEIFFRRLSEAFLAPHVFHLGFIEVGGERAAGAVGLAYKNTFSLYNSAFDRRFGHLSPGMVLVSDLIRLAIEEEREHFDLLKGDLGYKYRFGATPRQIGRLLLER